MRKGVPISRFDQFSLKFLSNDNAAAFGDIVFFCPLDFFVLIWLLYFSGVMILVYIFELYLDLRQRAALKLPTVPKPLAGIISQEKYEKSRAYSLDKKY